MSTFASHTKNIRYKSYHEHQEQFAKALLAKRNLPGPATVNNFLSRLTNVLMDGDDKGVKVAGDNKGEVGKANGDAAVVSTGKKRGILKVGSVKPSKRCDQKMVKLSSPSPLEDQLKATKDLSDAKQLGTDALDEATHYKQEMFRCMLEKESRRLRKERDHYRKREATLQQELDEAPCTPPASKRNSKKPRMRTRKRASVPCSSERSETVLATARISLKRKISRCPTTFPASRV